MGVSDPTGDSLPRRHESSEAHERLERRREYERARRRVLRSRETPGEAANRKEKHRLRMRQYRLRETSEQRARRLESMRVYSRNRIPEIAGGSTRAVRNEEPHQLERMAEQGQLPSIPSDVAKRVEKELQEVIGPAGLDETVCAVCDRLTLSKGVSIVTNKSSDVLATLQRCLRIPDVSLPLALVKQYDCSDIHESLQGIMLSKSGVSQRNDGGFEIAVCAQCENDRRLDSSKPPKHAIANGFYVGRLPEDLCRATWMEKIMVQLVTNVTQTRIMRGGCHRAIRSHCLVYEATPGPPATLLPRSVDAMGSYKVVLAGPLTENQTEKIKKLHDVRGAVVSALLQFLVDNNHYYSDVEIADCEQRGGDVFSSVAEYHDATSTVDAIDNEQATVVGYADFEAQTEDEECRIIERSVLFVPRDTVVDTSSVQTALDLASSPIDVPRLSLQHSTRFARGSDIEPRMFAHLFPFGRGHPSESRKVPVSKLECIRHYLHLSTRLFARDPAFLFTAFSRLSLEKMYTMTSIRCQRYPRMFQGFETISKSDLSAALINRERRQRGQAPIAVSNANSERLLRSVEFGAAAVWGSDAERRQCRREAFAYQMLHGQPSLFVTLTPNSENSVAMAHYSGILSVESFFDFVSARTPTSSELHQAAMADDCASARLFLRLVTAFLSKVLCVDPTSKRATGIGLFGLTKAYYGVVETQGRGTLHIHFLIWISGMPRNAGEFETALRSTASEFSAKFIAYADSIVTTDMPLPVTDLVCTTCGCPWRYRALPIPSSARQNLPRRQLKERREPALLACETCDREVSPQHVQRQLLLQNRPPCFPLPRRSITREEAEEEIRQSERPVRCATRVRAAMHEREMNFAAISGDEHTSAATRNLVLFDSSRNAYVRPDDDPFRNDPMHRWIAITPPSPIDRRLSSQCQAYILTSLVNGLNTHWWGHTGSCFKKSRNAPFGDCCRYGYPRDREFQTRVDSSGITLRRLAGNEYVNGYTETIMANFKCNHDIQIVCGGNDARTKICYCCKYVTKSQKFIDCTSAAALANFQRRLVREEILASEGKSSGANRRLIASMTYTFTNKQEVAGPLAALYILRGSCSFVSHDTVRLQLGDALFQLDGSSYGCSVVSSLDRSHVTYRTASLLDDYLYRPPKYSLFTFTMSCYRRRLARPSTDTQFGVGHPLSSSHGVSCRNKYAVPVISGARLPVMTEEMSGEQKESFGKTALVLFKPFRSKTDLLLQLNGSLANGDSTECRWYESYQAWESSRSAFVRMVMSNMEDYYCGMKSESTNTECERSGDRMGENIPSGSDSGSDESDFAADEDDFLDAIVHSQQADGVKPHFPGPANHPRHVLDSLQKLGRVCFPVIVANTSEDDLHHDTLPTDEKSLRAWVVDEAYDNAQEEHLGGRNDCDLVTRITHLLETTNSDWQDPTLREETDRRPLATFCSIQEMSSHWSLNRLEHKAFSLIARNLLVKWKCRETLSPTLASDGDVRANQLLMYLGGEGGTGKSRVVAAVEAFCQNWERPHALVITALTGKAATLIAGRTLASFEVALQGKSGAGLMEHVDCVVIDEISMMSKPQLVNVERLLAKAKGIDGVPFGGTSMMLSGDFFQLPPVGSDPLYVDPDCKGPTCSLFDSDGFKLWRQFDRVVILQECMRFARDPEWGRGVSQARYGNWTPEFVAMINAQLLSRGEQFTSPRGLTFVAADNDTRAAINGLFVSQMSTNSTHLPIRVMANFKGALSHLSAADREMILALPDNKFGRMAPYLDLIPGMPIQVTRNIRMQKGVANGTTGHLHSVHFPSDTLFVEVIDRRTGALVSLPDRRPLFALLNLQRGVNAKPFMDGANPRLFPVFHDCTAYRGVSLSLTAGVGTTSRKIFLKIQQSPFVCSVGATVYKVQGESLASMAVVDWKADQSGANKPQQAYLMVSRVVERRGFTCFSPFTRELAQWAVPSAAMLDEDKRLRQLSETTNII